MLSGNPQLIRVLDMLICAPYRTLGCRHRHYLSHILNPDCLSMISMPSISACLVLDGLHEIFYVC